MKRVTSGTSHHLWSETWLWLRAVQIPLLEPPVWGSREPAECTRTELDTHAEAFCFGQSWPLLLSYSFNKPHEQKIFPQDGHGNHKETEWAHRLGFPRVLGWSQQLSGAGSVKPVYLSLAVQQPDGPMGGDKAAVWLPSAHICICEPRKRLTWQPCSTANRPPTLCS